MESVKDTPLLQSTCKWTSEHLQKMQRHRSLHTEDLCQGTLLSLVNKKTKLYLLNNVPQKQPDVVDGEGCDRAPSGLLSHRKKKKISEETGKISTVYSLVIMGNQW